jgi:Phage tail tube protein
LASLPTTGYSAGVETNSVILSYIKETAYGTAPASAAKQLRFTSESLASTKSRQRATEVDATRQAADQVTTQFSAGGTINGALSIGTYDDLFASLFCAAWATDVLNNGAAFESLYLQKQLASNLWLRYPGAFVTSASIGAAQGGFVTVSFNILAQNEVNQTTDAGTGAQTAAPTGKIVNTVSMTSAISLGGAGLTKVESFSLDISNEGAAQQFAMGSTAAAGMLPGVFTVNGRLRVFFSDFTLYTRYTAETEGAFTFTFTDANTSYVFLLHNCVVMNPSIVAGGPGQSVMADFTIEGRKDPVTGKTLRITRDLTP